MMNVVFRVDASLQIGTGHVMRCLTLADALASNNARCFFICREHPGNLLEFIRRHGYVAYSLPAESGKIVPANAADAGTIHVSWLGCDWLTDAQQTRSQLDSVRPDWLIVDHYALDVNWERMLRAECSRLMVIDDLADREHDCDLLLDQNLGRVAKDYFGKVPSGCTVLTGAWYALLRPEFAALRDYSLYRRKKAMLEHLLISMGGVDQPNATNRVLETLKACRIPNHCRITVVMGASSPWLDMVKETVASMPWQTDVRVNVTDMAQLMADSDLAIGAAGGTAWERCCLGLPSLMIVLAENQRAGATALHSEKAVRLVGEIDDIQSKLPLVMAEIEMRNHLAELSLASSRITDGQGANRVLQRLCNQGNTHESF